MDEYGQQDDFLNILTLGFWFWIAFDRNWVWELKETIDHTGVCMCSWKDIEGDWHFYSSTGA